MNLRHLRAFSAIVELGSFARAAARVNLSQPALSRQIRALETDLGVRLFEKVGRRARLTAEGEDVLRRARRLLAEADSLGERARSLKAGESGILRVGATPQVIENHLSGFLPHYFRRHPGVEVELVEEGGARLPERLERGDVQLACMSVGDSRFEYRLLAPMHAMAVLREGHRLARSASVEIAALAEERLLVLRAEFASRAWFDAACEIAHIRPRVLLQSAAPGTIIALAATGYGIAIVPSNARFPQSGVRVRPLVHRGESIGRWAIVAWHPGRFLPAYAKHFATELVAYTRGTYPGRELTRRAPPLRRPKESA